MNDQPHNQVRQKAVLYTPPLVPPESAGLIWTPMDSAGFQTCHISSHGGLLESSGVQWSYKKYIYIYIVHKRNLVLSAGVRRTRLHQSEKKDSSPETGFLAESTGVCQTGLHQSFKKREQMQDTVSIE